MGRGACLPCLPPGSAPSNACEEFGGGGAKQAVRSRARPPAEPLIRGAGDLPEVGFTVPLALPGLLAMLAAGVGAAAAAPPCWEAAATAATAATVVTPPPQAGSPTKAGKGVVEGIEGEEGAEEEEEEEATMRMSTTRAVVSSLSPLDTASLTRASAAPPGLLLRRS